jgi:hypothetical protein
MAGISLNGLGLLFGIESHCSSLQLLNTDENWQFQGILPTDWKTANVVPIFKKGVKIKAENYRPVSLTSVVCKMMEHIICSSIMEHLVHWLVLCLIP